MVSYDEALKKAKKLQPRIDKCVEYPDAYMFMNKEDALSFGGSGSPVVILKSDGRAIGQTDFYDDPDMDVDVVTEFDIDET